MNRDFDKEMFRLLLSSFVSNLKHRGHIMAMIDKIKWQQDKKWTRAYKVLSALGMKGLGTWIKEVYTEREGLGHLFNR